MWSRKIGWENHVKYIAFGEQSYQWYDSTGDERPSKSLMSDTVTHEHERHTQRKELRNPTSELFGAQCWRRDQIYLVQSKYYRVEHWAFPRVFHIYIEGENCVRRLARVWWASFRSSYHSLQPTTSKRFIAVQTYRNLRKSGRIVPSHSSAWF